MLASLFALLFTVSTSATVVRITDGDTIVVRLVNCITYKEETTCGQVPVRIRYIDTPELRSSFVCERKLAQEAKRMAQALMPIGSTVSLSNIGKDKYRRVLAEVKVEGKSISQEMLKLGLARQYEGGKRLPWCSD